MRNSSAFTEVRCPGCGRERRLSVRHVRRGAILCRPCRYPAKEQPVTDAIKLWWLERFDDLELAAIATELIGRTVSPDVIHTNREILTASAAKRDAKK